MEITTDILLRGPEWRRAIDEIGYFFKPRINYNLFMLCLAIGIMYDRRLDSSNEQNEDSRSVPRNVLQNNDNGKLDFYFQAAILSTTTEHFTEEERLDLAFGEKTEFNKLGFLVQFANYGVTKLVENIGASPVESMENIKNFLCSSVEGTNFDIDDIPEEFLADDL